MKTLKTAFGEFGPFATIETLADRYRCDGIDYPFAVVREASVDGTPPGPPPPRRRKLRHQRSRQGHGQRLQGRRHDTLEVCQALLPKMAEFGIGQLINGQTWVHVGRGVQANPINRLLTIDKRGTRAGILQAAVSALGELAGAAGGAVTGGLWKVGAIVLAVLLLPAAPASVRPCGWRSPCATRRWPT